MSNYSKEQFIKFWGLNGYTETWDGHKYNWSEKIKNFIKEQIGFNKDKISLEIGCGSGYWTDFLAENSNLVYAIDLIPRPEFKNNNITYIENQDRQFNCSNLEDNSVDFAFSFGVFCHFSLDACESYLKDVLRVLKKGGTAIFMYSDEIGLKNFYKSEISPSSIYGEHNDYSDIMPTILKYDPTAKKILDFRDALVLITKT
jgi:SAM-dependent methyltransferase